MARRLTPVLAAAGAGSRSDIRAIAAILVSVLAGREIDTPASDMTPILIEAARDLIVARGANAAPDATEAWIRRYLAPTSHHRLPGAATLWMRAVNLQRDRERRNRLRIINDCPMRITLSHQHRVLLAKARQEAGAASANNLVGRLVERIYGHTTGKRAQKAGLQPELPIAAERDLFG